MLADDKIVIVWESIETVRYRKVMTLEEYAEVTGVPVAELLTYDDPSGYGAWAVLNMADELASVEDSGEAGVTWESFTREVVSTRLMRRRDGH